MKEKLLNALKNLDNLAAITSLRRVEHIQLLNDLELLRLFVEKYTDKEELKEPTEVK